MAVTLCIGGLQSTSNSLRLTIHSNQTISYACLAQRTRRVEQSDGALVAEARVLAWQHNGALLGAETHQTPFGVVQLDTERGHVLDHLLHVGAALAGGVAAVLQQFCKPVGFGDGGERVVCGSRAGRWWRDRLLELGSRSRWRRTVA